MLEKITEIEWDIELQTMVGDYTYHLSPFCKITVCLEDGSIREFEIQIGDKALISDEGKDISQKDMNRIIDRIEKPLRKEVDMLMSKVERIYKHGSFGRDFLGQFWLDNIMGK